MQIKNYQPRKPLKYAKECKKEKSNYLLYLKKNNSSSLPFALFRAFSG